jgi:hypothetical protein
MTTKTEPLAGLELAVAVAESVMGWPIRHVTDYERNSEPGVWPYLLVRSSPEYTELIVHYTRKSNGDRPEGWHIWEPWRDMRAAWEVVEKMQALRDEPNEGYARWVNFANLLRGGMLYTLTSEEAGLAILRAALATVKGEADA